ncbi:MAG TPA: carbohydrate kinase family protein [Gaiellaceae bacterium]|nr:carbohydrate kinase family protein [Gaiellaceae bacterium]
MPRLGVIGHLSRDVIANSPPRTGGGPWHAARALKLLDEDALIVEKGPEYAFSFSYDDDGARTMYVDSIGRPWRIEEIPSLDGIEWVQVVPLLRGDFDADVLEWLARGRKILLDGQGLARARQTGPLRLDGAFDPELLRHVTALKLAVEEAAVVGDVDVPELLITDGTRGATVNGAHIAADVVATDPTGAGDAFAIAYISARAHGHEPVDAGRRATALVAELLRR